jgi:hypothetical protein
MAPDAAAPLGGRNERDLPCQGWPLSYRSSCRHATVATRTTKRHDMGRIVYLDQNKWIDLSREHHGRDPQHRFEGVLVYVLEASAAGTLTFPLSLAHYMETMKHGNPERRLRLARFMLRVSRCATLAPIGVIVRHEIEQALSQVYPGRVPLPAPLTLVGPGVHHATGGMIPVPRIPWGDLSPEQRMHAWYLFEEATLSGVFALNGVTRREMKQSEHDLNFKGHLDKWGRDGEAVAADVRKRSTWAIALVDIQEPFLAALVRHGITWPEIQARGVPAMGAFLESMPTRRVDMHLHRQWAKNKGLQANRNDLNDWGLVGAAVAYCDVVVTEKRLADLVNRPGLEKNAKVITDLRELPKAV